MTVRIVAPDEIRYSYVYFPYNMSDITYRYRLIRFRYLRKKT